VIRCAVASWHLRTDAAKHTQRFVISGGLRNARFEGLFAVANRWQRGIGFLSFRVQDGSPHRNRRLAGPRISVLPRSVSFKESCCWNVTPQVRSFACISESAARPRTLPPRFNRNMSTIFFRYAPLSIIGPGHSHNEGFTATGQTTLLYLANSSPRAIEQFEYLLIERPAANLHPGIPVFGWP
jgi:hypothetical protein